MASLYGSLGVKSSASSDKIASSYKKLAYKYISNRLKDQLLHINGAKEILLEIFKRDFYDLGKLLLYRNIREIVV